MALKPSIVQYTLPQRATPTHNQQDFTRREVHITRNLHAVPNFLYAFTRTTPVSAIVQTSDSSENNQLFFSTLPIYQ